MSYSVVISFEIPNDLVFSNLSNERYDKEKEFIVRGPRKPLGL